MKSLRIATWNVNSVRQRIEHLLRWLKDTAPDVVCLQEIKTVDETFPSLEIEALGYHVAVHGQKTFNGVALLSKFPLEDVRAWTAGGSIRRTIQVCRGRDFGTRRDFSCGNNLSPQTAILLPATNMTTSCAGWNACASMRRSCCSWRNRWSWPATTMSSRRHAIPTIRLCGPMMLFSFRRHGRRSSGLLTLGLTDAVRATTDAEKLYSFWDYQAGAWQRNNGIRIDHLLPLAAGRRSAR